MKFFINAGVLERLPKDCVTEEGSKIVLSIPNNLKNECTHEDIKFIFEVRGLTKEAFSRDFILENVSLKHSSKNSYYIRHSKKSRAEYMYALIRSTAVPDDVFIPGDKKGNVRVLRWIRFDDAEIGYRDFLSNVYLIRINLRRNESIPIYLTNREQCIIDNYYVFFKTKYSSEYHVSKKSRPHMKAGYNDISLSEI